ncbi:unnamed protein product [Prorocentrum cordatum]|uniref:Uncharacterized protein n=1 Tax=Prorocentrum cordatum TaxID=2364126 RepID=A0ABN9X4Z3_9DINO|nr:unnamed protein product [Polarella glacialis]
MPASSIDAVGRRTLQPVTAATAASARALPVCVGDAEGGSPRPRSTRPRARAAAPPPRASQSSEAWPWPWPWSWPPWSWPPWSWPPWSWPWSCSRSPMRSRLQTASTPRAAQNALASAAPVPAWWLRIDSETWGKIMFSESARNEPAVKAERYRRSTPLAAAAPTTWTVPTPATQVRETRKFQKSRRPVENPAARSTMKSPTAWGSSCTATASAVASPLVMPDTQATPRDMPSAKLCSVRQEIGPTERGIVIVPAVTEQLGNGEHGHAPQRGGKADVDHARVVPRALQGVGQQVQEGVRHQHGAREGQAAVLDHLVEPWGRPTQTLRSASSKTPTKLTTLIASADT